MTTLENSGKEYEEMNEDREPSFIYKDGKQSKVNLILAARYPGSYFFRAYMSCSRTSEKDVFIDRDGKNDDLVVKYMKNDKSLINDIKKMNIENKKKFLYDLEFFELPIKSIFISELVEKSIKEIWNNQRVVIVNGKSEPAFNDLLKMSNLFDPLFEESTVKNIQVCEENNIISINLTLKYLDLIEDYLRNKKLNVELVKKYKYAEVDATVIIEQLIDEMKLIGMKIEEDDRKTIKESFASDLFQESKILETNDYDSYIKDWTNNGKWKLLYRASENNFSSFSFHACCDKKGPTLILIKSKDGNIFGGYATALWSQKSKAGI